MLKFNSLHLKNCVYFKDAKLPLNTGEVLVVNGRNLRSREKQQTNGSGKSLFFSYVPNIVFANHPLAIRANSKKEMFSSGVNGRATVDFTSGDANYVVSQKGGGSSVGYDIKKNGKSQKIRTTPLSERFIRAAFPLTEAEFYTTVYLNSQREFIFQRGKADARLRFFTEFFRLDYYDQMKAMFQEDLRKVKRVEIEVSTLEGQRLRLVEDLKELEEERIDDVDDLVTKLDELKRKRKKLAARVDSLTKTKSFAELHAQLMKSIGSAERPSTKIQEKLDQQIEAIEKQIEAKRRIKQLERTIAENKEAVAEVKTRLRKICNDLGLSLEEIKSFDPNSEVASKYRKLEDALELMETKKDRHTRLMRKVLAAKEKIVGKVYSEAELATIVDESNQQIKAYKKLKEHIEDDTCPICGSVVDLETLRKKSVAAQKKLAEVQAQLEYNEISLGVKDLDFDSRKYKETQKQLAELKPEYEKHEKVRSKYRSVIDLLAEYKSSNAAMKKSQESLESAQGKLDASIKTDKLDSLREQLASSETLMKLFKQLDNLNKQCEAEDVSLDGVELSDVKESLQKASKLYTKFEGDIEDITAKVNRNNVHEEKEKLLNRKLKEVNTKIEELNSVVADKELLENLIKVYSNKGIKIQRVNAICRILERNLNHFKNLLFDENFKFKINITEKDFDVIVDRGDGVVSDVRTLSGSEGRRFNLLLLISLLPLTPANRRCNLVVLDEMESNASATTIRLFCERFIPELHKLVPNIIVVTPLDLRIENSKRVLVTKDKDGSRIEFVNELRG